MLIGALSASLLFVTLGAGTTYTTEKQNKYEFHVVPTGSTASGFIINTENGVTHFCQKGQRILCN